jgi:hypothetical protein
MAPWHIVYFGKQRYEITSARWDKKNHAASISFEDAKGRHYHTIAAGMSKSEQRYAVFEAVRDAWIKARADTIGNPANQPDSTLRQLAIACGNHPYEDGI